MILTDQDCCLSFFIPGYCPAPRYSPEHFILLCPQIYILPEKPQRAVEKVIEHGLLYTFIP
jgi:hypothetical protein